ncbi:MAG TPA: hypothetical protein VHK65_07335 [Candidatus Dormibacteraeota bacterium]|nr:hypothetical protein [Candidatus Dormibacteraeota bacterium]
MLRWLTRLFGQHNEAETAPAVAPPLETPPAAVAEPTPSEAVAVSQEVAVAEPVEAESAEVLTLVELPETTADAEAKETCPNCGRTSVFAGPPGQRFCTYCALRDELFERSAAATE